jgi:hypothetical protein
LVEQLEARASQGISSGLPPGMECLNAVRPRHQRRCRYIVCGCQRVRTRSPSCLGPQVPHHLCERCGSRRKTDALTASWGRCPGLEGAGRGLSSFLHKRWARSFVRKALRIVNDPHLPRLPSGGRGIFFLAFARPPCPNLRFGGVLVVPNGNGHGGGQPFVP